MSDSSIRVASVEHLARWVVLRAALWPESSDAMHEAEARAWLATPDARAFMAVADGGEFIGFAETSLRRDHVNGCDTTPVVFLEGMYVLPRYRRGGVAAKLCAAVEAWGRSMGCQELGSDADEANPEGLAFHAGAGFEERERVVFFRKLL